MKTVLVTGGAGAIGSNFVKRLLDKNQKIIVIDDLSSGFISNLPAKSKKYEFIKGDICDDSTLKKAFSTEIDCVYHLAANFANQNSIDNPQKDLHTNGLGIVKLLQYAIEKKVEKFLYASSSCIYKPNNVRFTEDMALELETPYEITKLLGEHYVSFFCKYYGLQSTIVRYFNSYGVGEYPGKYRNVIPNFIWRAINGKSLIITGTGKETRSFTYVNDIVEGTILAMDKCVNNISIYNIGNENDISIMDLAIRINKLCGNKAGIELKDRRDWDKTLSRSCSIESAKTGLGFYPKINLDEGLALTLKWFKSINFKKYNIDEE